MLQQLINHSPDLAKLHHEGYMMAVHNGQYLVVSHVPYLTSEKEVKYGSLVAILTMATPSRAGVPPDHTIFFAGETPCNADGRPITAIILNHEAKNLAQGLPVTHQFSSRPLTGSYPDYYKKVSTYAEILCSQASIIDKSVTATPNKSKAA